MVWIDPEFELPTLTDDEKYEGTEVDANVLKGMDTNKATQGPTPPAGRGLAPSTNRD